LKLAIAGMGGSSSSSNNKRIMRVNMNVSAQRPNYSNCQPLARNIPDSRMYEYDKAVNDFMKQQEFK